MMRFMPTPLSSLDARTLLLAAACLGLAIGARAAQTPATPAKPGGPKPAGANAAPAELEIPKSIFITPTSPQQGRDPFFPQSFRMLRTVVVAPTNTPMIATELELKGISGPTERRLAIINTRTVAVGEEAEVISSQGKVRILCREIRADSVVVQVGNELRVLRLRARP